jgi:hypothetical protein
LRRVGVVNLPIFLSSLAAEAPPAARPGIAGTSALSTVSAFATRRLGPRLRGNHGGVVVGACADAGPDIAKQVAGIVDPSAIGFQMNDFRRKLFSQEARREPAVRFDTAGLSGLYPFATVRPHERNGFLRCVLVGPR